MKNIITLILLAFSITASAQFADGRGPITTAEAKHGPFLKWNKSAAFKDQPSPKALDWSTYPQTIDGKQITGWAAFAAAGVMWGAREAYHAQSTVFETRWGVGSESWFGSEAWKRNYVGNDPDRPHKTEIIGNFGRDIHHTFGTASKALLVGGTFTIGARRQPWRYRVVNTLLGWGLHSLAANLTYNALR